MKNIKIKKMSLKNFKGIKEMEINFLDNTEVRGANATGKTSICDAFTWLLFGKDSQGSSNFNIKTLDPSGEVIHNLDHSVECELEIDGVIRTLKKVYNEKWTRKKGDLNTELTGHETSCFINEVPYKINEFKKEIKDIVDEDIFKILSNPSNFEKLDWKKKREILLKICGNIDEESIFLLEEFKGLKEELNGRTLEQYKDVLNGQRRAFNDEIKDIPKRIDENNLKIKEVEETFEFLEKELKDLEIKEKVVNGNLNAGKEGQSLEIEKEILDIKKESSEKIDTLKKESSLKISEKEKEIKDKENSVKEIENLVYEKNRKISNFKDSLIKNNKNLEIKNSEIVEKRKEVMELKNKNIEKVICPICKGQGQVEIEQLEKNKFGFTIDEKELQDSKDLFNIEKSNKLIELQKQGVSLKTSIENIEKTIKEEQELLITLDKEIIDSENNKKEINKELEILKSEKEEIKKKLEKEIEEIEKETEIKIENKKLKIKNNDFSEEKEKFKQELEKISSDKKIISEKIFIIKNNEEIKNRNKELEEELKRISSKFLEAEKNIYKVERFTKARVELLEKEVANNFKNVGFKLFVEQVNGGLAETCETTVNGVPYSDVNTAGKINAGIDIINTLSRFYEVIVPLFIDNRESVTNIITTETQVINLIVDSEFKKLNINGGK